MRAHTSGSFEVYSRSSGEEVTPRGRKARALLAYLISNPGSKIPKSFLAGLLWGDRGEAQARSSLRQTLLELRHSINRSREIVCSDRDHVWLRPDTLVEHPGDESAGYRQPFQDLDDVTPEFDEWLVAERNRRESRRLAALKGEAEELLRSGRADESLTLIEQMQAIDPHNEDALRLAMEAEFERGHPAAIAERFRLTAALLYSDLGVYPSEEVSRLRDQLIKRLTASGDRQQSGEADQGHIGRVPQKREASAMLATQEWKQSHQTLANGYKQTPVMLVSSDREVQASGGQGSTPTEARYLRKGLCIQALQWFKHGDHPAVLADPAGVAGHIDTPEGRLRVDPGDWIITGISGEHYPCKPDIFRQLYTRAS